MWRLYLFSELRRNYVRVCILINLFLVFVLVETSKLSWHLWLEIDIAEAFPVLGRQVLILLHVLCEPIDGSVVEQNLVVGVLLVGCDALLGLLKVGLCVDPVAVDVAVDGFSEVVVEVWLVSPFYAAEVVVIFVNVLDALADCRRYVLVDVLDRWDELTVLDVVLGFLFFFERIDME